MNKLCVWRVMGVMLFALFATSARALEMINDSHFQTGFDVYAADGTYEGALQYTSGYGEPRWQLAQWNSQQSLYGVVPVEIADAWIWENAYKSMVLGPTTTAYADLQLGVNSVTEYNGVYRTAADQPWVHLLAAQAFGGPSGWLGINAPTIAQMTSANFNIDFKLVKADNIYGPGYNSNLHASLFPLYFSINNLNPASSGYGDYLWFGIGLYDDRYSPCLSGTLIDPGTEKLIYSLGHTAFGKTEGPQLGEWMNINGDILPHFKDALNYAWANDLLTDSMDYGDYQIGGINLGWEVPGLADVGMQVKNLSLNVHLPEPCVFILLITGITSLMVRAWYRRREERTHNNT